MPWAPLPGAHPPSTTLFVEAFGQLSSEAERAGIVTDEEDLYSVFRARSELMVWLDTVTGQVGFTGPHAPPALWGMEEAELTAGDGGSRIGFVQVGLGGELLDPVPALVPLVQCFDDALRRFGIVELSALQVIGSRLEPESHSYLRRLMPSQNWFNVTPAGRTDALIVLASAALDGQTEQRLAALQHLAVPARFGPVTDVPEAYAIEVSVEASEPIIPPRDAPSIGLAVSLPEWTASAAAWALAIAVDTVRPREDAALPFAARVARVS